jgi:hypothetical protein
LKEGLAQTDVKSGSWTFRELEERGDRGVRLHPKTGSPRRLSSEPRKRHGEPNPRTTRRSADVPSQQDAQRVRVRVRVRVRPAATPAEVRVRVRVRARPRPPMQRWGSQPPGWSSASCGAVVQNQGLTRAFLDHKHERVSAIPVRGVSNGCG